MPITTYRTVTTSVPVTSYQLVTAPGASPPPPAPVPTQPVAPGSNASKDPALLERDRKLKELEDRVQQLLKEMQQLRGQAPTGGTNNPLPPTPQDALLGLIREATGSGLVAPAAVPAPALVARPSVYPGTNVIREPEAEVITLTRVTYKLKAATAEALASFLKENVKTAILEINNKGDTLIVTTTPDAQHVIGQLIDLIQGKKPEATVLYRPAGTTPMPALPGGTGAPPWPKFIGPPVAK